MTDTAVRDVIQVLRQAADLIDVHGPDPVGCIRAVTLGSPDVVMPFEDTAESLLAEDAEYRLQHHLNPDSMDADEDVSVDEWATGRSPAEVRDACNATVDSLAAGVR